MTANLQTLIHSAEQLTPVEQLELINAVSRLLYQHYQTDVSTPTASFWQAQTIEQIVSGQQTNPVSNVLDLSADFWPEDESADDFIEFIQHRRQEDRVES